MKEFLDKSSIQRDDELVFPNQDTATLTMNIRAELDKIWKRYLIKSGDSEITVIHKFKDALRE